MPQPSSRPSRPRPSVRPAWTVLAVAVVLSCALPLLTGAAGRDDEEGAANRARIESMTELERRQLEQRLERYRKLSPDERDRLRSMHAKIEAEAELKQTVDAYRRWLETLSPIEREQLRSEPDAQKKLAIVERIRTRQRTEESKRPFEALAARFGGSRRPPRVDPAELEKVYTVLSSRLEPEVRERIEANSNPLVRHLETLRAATSQTIRPPRPGERFRPPKFPDDETLSEIRTALDGGPLGRMLASTNSDEVRRARVVGMLTAGVLQELGREWERRKPTDEQLQRHFARLPEEERRRLTSLISKEEFERELRQSYVASSMKELGDVRRLMQRLTLLSRSGRPPFGGGRGGRPDDGSGERAGPFGRPGGGGRRPGRPGEGERRDGPPPDKRPLGNRLRERREAD